MSHLDYLCRVDRRTDGGHLPVGQNPYVVNAVGVQGGHRTAGCGAEPDHRGAEAATIAARNARQLHCVQN